MERTNRMPRAALVLLLCALLLCPACQPTPEVEAVVNKGDGAYEQKLSEAQTTAVPGADGQKTGAADTAVPSE